MLVSLSATRHVDLERDFITLSRFAEMVGVGPTNIGHYIYRHKIPTVNVGGRRMMFREDAEKHLATLKRNTPEGA